MTEDTFPGWRGTNIVGVRQGRTGHDRGRRADQPWQNRKKEQSLQSQQTFSRCQDMICGFAVSTGNAFTLLERLDSKLDASPGQFARANVNLAKDWCTENTCKNWRQF
jgi:ATP-dependent HslUV protease subunit HslV